MPLVLADAATRLAIAALIGLAIGTEREWSGPRRGPRRRFAGLRTFLIFGIVGGAAGLLLLAGAALVAAVLLAAAAALITTAYAMSARRPETPLDGTTEVAALGVLGLGVLAAVAEPILAAGAGALMVFALGEKRRLHWLVRRIGEREMHAALQFLVLALVVLPLLPAGPLRGFFDLRPRLLWGMVLILSGINFASYLARRAWGTSRGYGVTGALAGTISSTALTLQFARLSRQEPGNHAGLAFGTLTASLVLPLRILVISLMLNPRVTLALVPVAGTAFALTAAMALPLRRGLDTRGDATPEPRNPLRLVSALQMALVIAVVFAVIDLARARWGGGGVVASSLVVGLADLDALTLSLSRQATDPTLVTLAARGIGIGLLANTLAKLALAVAIGAAGFRRRVGIALGGVAAGIALVLWWAW